MDVESVSAADRYADRMERVMQDLYALYTPYADEQPFLNGSHVRYAVMDSPPDAGELDEGEIRLGKGTSGNGNDEIFFSTDGQMVSRYEATGIID